MAYDLAQVIAEQQTVAAESWLRTGVITGTSQSPLLDVSLDGGALLLPKLGGYYAPVPGDVVAVLCAPGRKIVVGKIGEGASAGSGAQGPTGPAGVSVTGATVNGAGHLILTLSNSTTVDAGYVVGPAGATGAAGADGTDGTDGAPGATGPAGTGGIVARARRTTSSAAGSGTTTWVKVTELSLALSSGRTYRIEAPNVGVYSDQATELRLGLFATTNNTAPDPTNSGQLLTWAQCSSPAGGRVQSLGISVLYPSSSAVATFRVLLAITATISPGGTWAAFGNVAWPLELHVRDEGGLVAASGTQF